MKTFLDRLGHTVFLGFFGLMALSMVALFGILAVDVAYVIVDAALTDWHGLIEPIEIVGWVLVWVFLASLPVLALGRWIDYARKYPDRAVSKLLRVLVSSAWGVLLLSALFIVFDGLVRLERKEPSIFLLLLALVAFVGFHLYKQPPKSSNE
jgi:hypothetical protein